MTKVVAVQLETCHANTDGDAWYVYFDGEPDVKQLRSSQSFEKLVRQFVKKSSVPLDLEEVDLDEEVPNDLSRHTGLRRWYLGSAG